jgi:lipoprotein NlpI
VTTIAVTVLLGSLDLYPVTAIARAQTPQEIFDQAVTDFRAGRVEESASGFDQVARAQPGLAPQLWQRGIALYYAGRYEDCRRQFESHLTVNPNDVENSAWHFLCVARAESPEAALAALLPVGPDSRSPMREIYEMFRGRMTPQDVLQAAGGQPQARFYAHLYRGLYQEAMGRTAASRDDILLASDDRFAAVGGYMHMVAVVHRDLLIGTR